MTDIGSDMCHVSSRSYPYLLRDYWGIDQANMKSVACSGARVVFDYYRPLSGYLGQGDRLVGKQDISAVQQNAIERFLPGRVPQLEFVKKYQPAVVTLTGGGNDVGFVDMLTYCAFGSPLDSNSSLFKVIKEGLYGLATCSFAQNGSPAQKIINRAIADQYQYTVRLIQSIKQASPNTQVYVVGYPSFISEGTAACGNSLELDSQERAAIHYYLRLLNAELSRAANSESVSFVDIEDSLSGGRLCEGSEYVTGATNVLLSGGSARNNMFHPNAKGHEMIAAAIESAIMNSGAAEVVIPQRPSVVSGDAYQGAVLNAPIVQGTVPSAGLLPLSTGPNLFTPGATVSVTLYSDTINLGAVTALQNGSIASTLAHNTLPVGYHMLTLEGMGVDGLPLLVYQFVTVDNIGDTMVVGTSGDNTKTLATGSVIKMTGEQSLEQSGTTESLVINTPEPAVVSAVAAAGAPINTVLQTPTGFTLVDNRILFGLYAGLFIMTVWPLIRRVRAKAKNSR